MENTGVVKASNFTFVCHRCQCKATHSQHCTTVQHNTNGTQWPSHSFRLWPNAHRGWHEDEQMCSKGSCESQDWAGPRHLPTPPSPSDCTVEERVDCYYPGSRLHTHKHTLIYTNTHTQTHSDSADLARKNRTPSAHNDASNLIFYSL